MKIKQNYLYLAILCLSGCSSPKTMNPSFTEISCQNTLAEINQDHSVVFLEKPFWLYFEDHCLDELQKILSQDNKTLLAEEHRIKTIFDNVTALKGSILPQFNYVFQDFFQYYSRSGVFAELTRDRLPSYYNDLTTGIGFNWNLDLGGQQKFLYKSLIQQGIANLFKLKGTHLDLSAILAKTYYSLKILWHLQKELSTQLSFANKQLNLTLALMTFNQTDSQHVIDLEQKIKKIEIELDAIMHNAEADQVLLKTLLAKMPDQFTLAIDQQLPENLPFVSLSNLTLSLIAQRPDIQMAVNLLNESRLKIKSAKAAFYPNISLTSLSGFDSVNFSKLFHSSSLASTFAPILTLPIFSAGVLNANLRKEKHMYESLIHSYDQALLKAAKEVVTFGSKFTTSKEDFSKSLERLDLESDKTELTECNYRAGLVSEIHYLEAQIQESMKKVETLSYHKDYIFSFIDLATSMGGGL